MTLEEVGKLTNQNGRDFLIKFFKNGKVNFAYFPKNGNWFYVLLNDNTSVSLPYSIKGVSATIFGDRQYLENHLKEQHGVHDYYLKYKLGQPINISAYAYQIEQFNIELADYLKGDLDVLGAIKSITYKIYKIFTKDYSLPELNTILTDYLSEIRFIFKKKGVKDLDLFTNYFLEAHSYFTFNPLYGDTCSYPELVYKLSKLKL